MTEYILQCLVEPGKWRDTRFNAWMAEADIREYFNKYCNVDNYRMVERITKDGKSSERVLEATHRTEDAKGE